MVSQKLYRNILTQTYVCVTGEIRLHWRPQKTKNRALLSGQSPFQFTRDLSYRKVISKEENILALPSCGRVRKWRGAQNHLKRSSGWFEIILNVFGLRKRISWPPIQLSHCGIRANDNTQKQGIVLEIPPCFKFLVGYKFRRPEGRGAILLRPFSDVMRKGIINILP